MKRIQAPKSWLLDKKTGGIFVHHITENAKQTLTAIFTTIRSLDQAKVHTNLDRASHWQSYSSLFHSSYTRKLNSSISLNRRRLKYALSFREAQIVVNDNEGGIKVDGKVRRDAKYPAGLMGTFL